MSGAEPALIAALAGSAGTAGSAAAGTAAAGALGAGAAGAGSGALGAGLLGSKFAMPAIGAALGGALDRQNQLR